MQSITSGECPRTWGRSPACPPRSFPCRAVLESPVHLLCPLVAIVVSAISRTRPSTPPWRFIGTDRVPLTDTSATRQRVPGFALQPLLCAPQGERIGGAERQIGTG
jgi:hypothetical protein